MWGGEARRGLSGSKALTSHVRAESPWPGIVWSGMAGLDVSPAGFLRPGLGHKIRPCLYEFLFAVQETRKGSSKLVWKFLHRHT